MPSKIILLNQKPKNKKIIYITFTIISLTSILLSCKIKTYDSKSITGLSECQEECVIKFSMPYNEIEILSKETKLEYQNILYSINDIKYQEPYLNNNIPYQDIEIITSLNLEKNKILNFKLLYNKQRIITKIKNIILEGD